MSLHFTWGGGSLYLLSALAIVPAYLLFLGIPGYEFVQYYSLRLLSSSNACGIPHIHLFLIDAVSTTCNHTTTLLFSHKSLYNMKHVIKYATWSIRCILKYYWLIVCQAWAEGRLLNHWVSKNYSTQHTKMIFELRLLLYIQYRMLQALFWWLEILVNLHWQIHYANTLIKSS